MRYVDPDWDTFFGDTPVIEPERLIYRYTTIEQAAALALTSRLTFSPLRYMNDPKERTVRQIITQSRGGAGVGASPKEEELKQLRDEINDWRLNVRLSCFTQDSREAPGGHLATHDERGYARSAMWSHYGADHRGVCLAFDRQALSEAGASAFAERWHEGSVEYRAGFDESDARAHQYDLDAADLPGHLSTRVVPSLFVKNLDWAVEREYRLAVVGAAEEEEVSLPLEGALVAVILGQDFPAFQFPLALAVAEAFGVEHMSSQMTYVYGAMVPAPWKPGPAGWSLWTGPERERAAWRATAEE